jgi:hypothetical protein
VRYKYCLLGVALFSGVAFIYATPAYAQTSVSSVPHHPSAALADSSVFDGLTISGDEGAARSKLSEQITVMPMPAPIPSASTSTGDETGVDIATEVTGIATAAAALAAIGTLVLEGRRRRRDQWQDWLLHAVEALGDAERYQQWTIPQNASWELNTAAEDLRGIARRLDNSRSAIPLLPAAPLESIQTADSLRSTAIAAANFAGHLSHASYLSHYLRSGTRPDQEIYSSEADRRALSDALEASYKDKELMGQRAKESFGQLKHYTSKVSKGTRKVLVEHASSINSARKDLPSSNNNLSVSRKNPQVIADKRGVIYSAPSLEPDPLNPEFIVSRLGSYRPVLDGSPVPTVRLMHGELPAGLHLRPDTGEISGTPVYWAAARYPITLGANNGRMPAAILKITLIVSDNLAAGNPT